MVILTFSLRNKINLILRILHIAFLTSVIRSNVWQNSYLFFSFQPKLLQPEELLVSGTWRDGYNPKLADSNIPIILMYVATSLLGSRSKKTGYLKLEKQATNTLLVLDSKWYRLDDSWEKEKKVSCRRLKKRIPTEINKKPPLNNQKEQPWKKKKRRRWHEKFCPWNLVCSMFFLLLEEIG